MNESRLISLIVVALMLACGLLGYQAGRSADSPQEVATIYQTDTVVVRDTITRELPVPIHTHTRDTIRVQVTDTLYIELPREVKVYQDSTYRAEVSGYRPNLDRIDIYAQERIVTQHKTQIVEVKRNARWGVGIQSGYGVCVTGGMIKSAPYIGVGLSWNFLTF